MELSRGVIQNGHVVWGVLAICIHSPSIAFSELLLLTPRVPLCQLIEAALALSVGRVRRANVRCAQNPNVGSQGCSVE